MVDLIESIKKAAIEAVNEQKPMAIRFGTVKSCNPFEIQLSNKIILTHEFLYLSASYYKSAKAGDRVMIIAFPGGQKFFVTDRVVVL